MSRCMRPGPITSNGYLNFLREFRKKCCGMSAVETVRQGAKAWNRLSCKQKAKYRAMACKRPRRKKRRSCRPKRRRRSCRPKRRKRRSCRPKRRKRSSCRRKRRPKRRRSCRRRSRPRRRRCGRKRKRCMKPGPVTANAYLNFLRAYRRKHCGLSPQETVQKGARRWCSLSPECKRRYMRQACKMSKSKRKKRSAICRSFRKKRRC
ncbi:protamine-like protein 99C [Bactrocera oleae]|uniref:protamine-like protein 99C n=1 Tax=Bactrocera oleae TaxID=104688 RepID=UPI0006B72C90|nr:protamine [Bactrocera oleae]